MQAEAKEKPQQTTKPMRGTWILVAPDGRKWLGESPIQCVSREQRTRVPDEVALVRIEAESQVHDDRQYGPLSTAMIDIAGEASYLKLLAMAQQFPYVSAAYGFMKSEKPLGPCEYKSDLHRSLYMLFLAEFLADEGL